MQKTVTLLVKNKVKAAIKLFRKPHIKPANRKVNKVRNGGGEISKQANKRRKGHGRWEFVIS
jgi:hypothetical protein